MNISLIILLYHSYVPFDQAVLKMPLGDKETEAIYCYHGVYFLVFHFIFIPQKNTGLNTENCRLKKNISALLRTARLEVTRKDAEIQRLIQR